MSRYSQGMYMIPEHMHEGLKRYIEDGIKPGDFLRLMLEHRIYEAAGRADDINKDQLYQYIYYMYNYMPMQSHGSEEIVANWIKLKGLSQHNQGESS